MDTERMRKSQTLLRNDKGAAAIEYALVASLISIAAVAAMGSVGNSLNNSFTNTANALP